MPFRGVRDTPLEHCHSQEWTRPRTSLRQPGPRSASSASTPPPPGSDSLFGGQRAPAEPLGPADSAPPPRTGQRGDAKLLMPQPVSVEAARAGRPAEGRRPGDRATWAGAPIPRPRNPEAGPGRGAGWGLGPEEPAGLGQSRAPAHGPQLSSPRAQLRACLSGDIWGLTVGLYRPFQGRSLWPRDWESPPSQEGDQRAPTQQLRGSGRKGKGPAQAALL